MRTENGKLPDLEHGGAAEETRPDPVGFRWYLRSSLPVSWLAKEVMPAIRYLLHTERLPVVNVRRGWLHGTHLEVIAHFDDGRPVPWTQVLARMRPPQEEATSADPKEDRADPKEDRADPKEDRADPKEDRADPKEDRLAQARAVGKPEYHLPLQPHGTFEWIAGSDFRPWPGQAQDLRERALTKMIDSMAVTLEPGEQAPLGQSAPLDVIAEIMLATADAHPLGVRYGTISLRAHAERFLDWSGPAYSLRTDFERELRADWPALRSLVERMLNGADTPSAVSWRRTASYCMGLFDGAVLVGALTPEVVEEIGSLPGGALLESTGPSYTAGPEPKGNEFYRMAGRADVSDRPAAWSPSYQLLLDLLYTQLPLLGASWRRTHYLCWALAATMDEVAGETRR